MTKIKKLKYTYLIFVFILITSSIIVLHKTNRINAAKIYGQNGGKLDEDNLKVKTSQQYRPFSVGTSSGPHTLEIVDSWDSASNNVLEQVVETLFTNNLSDLDLPLVNQLAESYYWINMTALQIKLREGVLFHDGTPFNAAAAKWNLDRLNFLINATGDNHGTVAQTKSLWSFPDGVTPIMNNVVVNSEYNITITLNGAYAPFLNTLTYINAGMISPTFHAADAQTFIPLSGNVCGTGPFVYDGYTPNILVSFHAFGNYWQGTANISQMTYVIFDDANNAHQAFLNNQIDWNLLATDQNIATYRTIPHIYVKDFTDETGKPSLVYQYMGVNNHKYNTTWRKAFAFAVNYSYVIEELRLGNALRSYTAISPAFGAAYNASVSIDPRAVPDEGNVVVARETLQSMGYGVGLDVNVDQDWIDQAASAPFKTVRYTYNLGNTFREDLYVAVTVWLKLIGCATEDDGVQWDQFLDYLYDVGGGTPDQGFDHLELYVIGWAPDYLEPYNMLDPLFNPISGSNSAQVNDPTLNALMAAALTETDLVARDTIYKHIQSYMATQSFNHIPLYHTKIVYAHSNNLTNFPYNALNKLYFYPCEWVSQLSSPPYRIYIDDLDSNFNWTKTAFENEWCTGVGTLNDPYIIKDLEIDGGGIYNGIEIRNSNVYFKIENCTIHNTLYGVSLISTNNSLVYNNTIYDVNDIGIWLNNSHNNEITYNRILNVDSITTPRGISLSYSHNNTISLNELMDPTPSVYSYAISLMYSNNSILTQNTIYQYGLGIYSWYSFTSMILNNDLIENQYGVGIIFSSNNIIKDNYVYHNSGYGIVLLAVDETKVLNNQILENEIIGILLDYEANQNTLYLNFFTGNGLNAKDNGTLNEWDNGTIGNSWDDYSGEDLNDDGIGDTPYLIEGLAGSYDDYPIFDDGPNDSIPPIISVNTPINGETFSDSVPLYEISILEDNLDTMWYTMDGGLNNIIITSNTGTLDELIWNTLPDGQIIIRFFANDTSGNLGSVQIIVQKDVAAPNVVINVPNTGDEYTTYVPLYDIDVIEDNLHTVWYTLNNGVNSVITVYAGIIDEELWNDLPNGPVTITFYANDTAGNLGSDTVIIYKSTPSNTPIFIPGPNVMLIFFLAIVGMVGLSWRNSKKIKTN